LFHFFQRHFSKDKKLYFSSNGHEGYGALEDLETGEAIAINAKQATEEYKEALEKHLSAIRMQLLGKRIFYKMISTNQPLDEALRDFLMQRNKGYV